VLTIFLYLFLRIYVSYIWTKYSDFGYFGFYKIFQIWGIMNGMGILENFENAWDLHNGVDEPNTESAWDQEFSFESKPIVETDHKGDPITWETSNQ
jgi:hypothetical protein